ncbi:hypothetical protein FNT36_10385 [Hymenobacter setariae]|uniref:MoxR-vWA-beta-propeller ternary system domain-containing protein n=1 Tax=Hymenobacter setariae TaxID=2594794 RepID=A0A558BZ99_9BACT|nr:hypothetical protein [Hymenobacter setariae]TVT41821.1 hypothetical protein FNT36_10385 [Hymenobacter setariae]
MQLTLRYHEQAQRPACAAFLRGTDPAAWLRELGRWQLAASQLSCYLVPESIRSGQLAGLFVVVAEGASLPTDVLEPYGQVAGQRLYVPVQAGLWPATTPDELQAALLWPRQLLHPSIGLVGFDTIDELDLGTLLDCAPPRPTDWGRAQPGHSPKPRLQQLRVLRPTAAEVLETLQQDVGTAPLTDLPGTAEAQPGPVRQWFEQLRYQLVKTCLGWVRRQRQGREPSSGHGFDWGRLFKVLGGVVLVAVGVLGIFALLSQGSFSSMGIVLALVVRMLVKFLDGNKDARPAPAPHFGRPQAAQPGRLEKWLAGNLNALEKKRQNEIERLLRLFNDNPAEALKYAIPLGGPYQNRGTAPPLALLGPRNTSFNLSGLGGGRATDQWDIGDYQHDLRRQYQSAANQELLAGRYAKAAYIHAHLLGDYLAAANALEQGHLFREAAALHKDHLHSPAGAARCLERGGLLLEAAEIYAELTQHEKAGDLYTQLAQPALAARHYERGITLLLDNDDRPAAARLLADKLHAPDRAQQVLLEGWASPKQPEVCLTQYFELASAQAHDLGAQVQTVFRQHTTSAQQVPLLRVLATVADRHATPELLTASRDIAYEVISTEAAAGNLEPLPLLRHFEPTDRLLAADCSRYTTSQPLRATVARRPATMQLDATIKWKQAASHRHQWVALGVRGEQLHLARGNWYGHLEYYSWAVPLPAETHMELVVDEFQSTTLLVRTSANAALPTLHLPKNKHFAEALTVECPTWLPPWPTRVAVLPTGTAAAQLQGDTVLLQRYTATGQLLPALTYRLSTAEQSFSGTEYGWPGSLLYYDGKYFTYWQNQMIWLAESGRHRMHILPTEAYQLVRSPYTAELSLAVVSEEGFMRWEPSKPTRNAPWEQLTADDASPSIHGLCFVGAAHVVGISINQASLYALGPDGAQLVRLIEVPDLVAVLPTSHRQQFALLASTGRLSLHQLDEE